MPTCQVNRILNSLASANLERSDEIKAGNFNGIESGTTKSARLIQRVEGNFLMSGFEELQESAIGNSCNLKLLQAVGADFGTLKSATNYSMSSTTQ